MTLLRSRIGPLSASLIVLALLTAACGAETDAVSISGNSLSRGDLDEILDEQVPATADGNHDSTTAADLIGQFIFTEAIAAELSERGFPITDAALAEAADALAVGDAAFDPETKLGTVSTRFQALGATFDQWVRANLPEIEVELPEYICASHILVETEEEAVAIGDRLANGENFAGLAVELSTGPSGPAGGDLGCAPTAASSSAEFMEAARLVAPSGVTGPVQTDFGWHVIQVRALGPLSAASHPEVDAATIAGETEAARTQAEQELVGPLADEIRTAAFARVDRDLELDARYGAWVSGIGVVPPDGVTSPDPTPLDAVPQG